MSSLPLELWLKIMRDVVHISGALETFMIAHFEWLQWRYNVREKYAESMANRLSLVQVCKAWYWLALELLYEDIRPRSSKHMSILRVYLDESRRTQSGSHPLGRGWWTKRFDFPLEGQIHVSDIAPLIAHFPNLLVLRFHNLQAQGFSLGTPPPMLRLTDLPAEPHPIPGDLDTLSLRPYLEYEYLFTNVTSLEISSLGNISTLRDYSFPNIRHLAVGRFSDFDPSGFEAFLNRYGRQLLSFHTETYDRIEQLLCKTPNLRELIFSPNDNIYWGDYTFPHVTHIGIMGGCKKWMSPVGNSFLNAARFCNLEYVRIVDDVFAIIPRPRLKAWYQAMGMEGVRYEDSMGRLLTDVMDEVSPGFSQRANKNFHEGSSFF